MLTSFHLHISSTKMIRVWDVENGECKIECRGHEHVVEHAIFAPITAYLSLKELTGFEVFVSFTQ